ncbi:MAG: uridine diphosphate-N-acetylglucosamine-binding protein YvcK [Candidatus Goldiibacteriota bacterium]
MFEVNKWLYPGIRIKRWIFLFVLSIIVLGTGLSGLMGQLVRNIRIEALNIDDFFYHLQRLKFIDFFLLALGIGGIVLAIRRVYFSVLAIFVPNKQGEFINIAYKRAKLKRGPKIATIGGGTGLPNVLRGLKEYTLNLSAIVTVADDGGSSGRLRKDYRILPPGDIRNCLVALADEETLLGRLFQYRFETGGDLNGHNFGNIYITALTHVVGDFTKAVNESSKVLAIHGRVLPVSLDNITLKAVLEDGREISGESKIPEANGKIDRLEIIPKNPMPYEEAVCAIKEADAVIIGPGSLYTSIIPNLLVPGIKEALLNTKTLKIYVCNIMTQPGETDGYKVSDHLNAILKHTGAGKVIDYVIANNKNARSDVLKRYESENSHPVEIDREKISDMGIELIETELFEDGEYIRHSEEMLGKAIMKTMII